MNTNLNWDMALTQGTAEYDKLIAGMDKGAKALLELQKAGVPVIWRPFHETDGGWFWWSKGGSENFKKLWRIMYERYTNYWGLNNLIWICGYSGEVTNGWYPKVYNSDYMITLDEIPDVYHYQLSGNTNTDTETEIQKYSIGEVKKGDKITFHLEGTPNVGEIRQVQTDIISA